MKKLILALTAVVLASTILTGCTIKSVFDDSTKESLMKSFDEKIIEITNVEGMAYFCNDADYVQLVDADRKPITYENGKNHNLLIRNINMVEDDTGIIEITYIIEDAETGVKWLSCIKMAGLRFYTIIETLYESDTDLILGEDGLPKVD